MSAGAAVNDFEITLAADLFGQTQRHPLQTRLTFGKQMQTLMAIGHHCESQPGFLSFRFFTTTSHQDMDEQFR
jgi:hypothetical protein